MTVTVKIKIHNSSQCVGFFLSLICLAIIFHSGFVNSFHIPSSISKNKTVAYTRSALGLRQLVFADLLIAKTLTENVYELPQASYLRKASEMYLEDVYRGNGMDYSRNKFTQAQSLVIAKNPIASYRTIRRMSTLLWDLVFHAKGYFDIPGEEATRYLYRGLPDQNDLNEAMDGILRLHATYDFNIYQFSSGNIFGLQTGAKLDAVHCYEIAEYALDNRGKYWQAVEWLQLALNKVTVDDDTTIDRGSVASFLLEAVNEHDEAFKQSNGSSYYTFVEPIASMMRNGNLPNRKARQQFEYEKYENDIKPKRNEGILDYYDYTALCRGKNLQSLEIKSKLFCWLEFKAHPKYLIGPMKMEFLARSPDVVQIYNVIGDKMMTKMKRTAAEGMAPSVVLEDKEDGGFAEGVVRESRISENTFLNDKQEEFLPVAQTISHITGLTTISKGYSEYIQVASYTTSGLYEPHEDADLPVENQNGAGDRIATFMIYMSDVQIGGETAFPLLGMAARPIKGSAVFWYNTLRSEKSDVWTTHGGCPVVFGQKYVANKWIRYFDQFSSHKCSINYKERFQIAVNGNYQSTIPIEVILNPTPSNQNTLSLKEKIDVTTKSELNQVLEQALSKYSYRSAQSLQLLAKTEHKIYNVLKLLNVAVNKNTSISMGGEPEISLKERNLCIQNYLKDYEDSNGKLISRSDSKNEYNTYEDISVQISWNPIATYRMIWRFENLLKKLIPTTNNGNDIIYLNQPYGNAIEAITKRIYNVSEGPDAIDLHEAKMALLMMQYIYDLRAKHMGSGMVAGRSTSVTLTALQCYDIGMEGISKEMYTIAIEWLEAALEKVKYGNDTSMSLSNLENALLDAMQIHDKMHALSQGWEPMFYKERFNDTDDYNPSTRRLTRKKTQYDAFRLKEESNFVEINFNGICAGKPHQTPQEKSNLFCWYEREIHPFWKINPLKAEFHSLRPKIEIVQYYDLLSDKVINTLKSLVTPNLIKSATLTETDDQKNYHSTDSRVRSSANSWVAETDSEDVVKISKLIERVTGLIAQNTTAEKLQIATYSPGGHYNVHTDVPDKVTSGPTSGRIATFMFYLSDVQLGGYTAFCQAGAKVVPRKGSAVFWYNLYSSEEPLQNTWHGACPVIFGEKWVANKWLLYKKQKKHKCHSSMFTLDEVLVNGKSKYDL